MHKVALYPQIQYLDLSDNVSFGWSGGNAIFSSSDDHGSSVRTYWRADPNNNQNDKDRFTFEGNIIVNYVTVERNTSDSIFGPSMDSVTHALIGQSDIHRGYVGVSWAYNNAKFALEAASSVSTGFSNNSYQQTRSVFVANERFLDEAKHGAPGIDSSVPINYDEQVSSSKFFILDGSASVDTFLIGGNRGIPDHIEAGSGNDVVVLSS